MLDFSRVQNYYIACGYTDMRKQIDGLAALVRLEYGLELNEESLFLFCGRKADRIKALYWDGTGHVLLTKRLAEKRFIAEATQQLSFPAPRQAALLMRINPDTMPDSDVADVGSGITIRHGESVITLPAGSSAEAVADLVRALNSHA